MSWSLVAGGEKSENTHANCVKTFFSFLFWKTHFMDVSKSCVSVCRPVRCFTAAAIKKKAKNSGLALVHFKGELVRKSNQKIIQCFRNINVCSSSALHTIIWCFVLHHSPSTL